MSYAPPPRSSGQASSQPAGPAPQYSPDGRWYWDGQQWHPAVAPGPPWSRPYAPPESRAAAAVALVAVAMAGAALFFVGESIELVVVLLAFMGSMLETAGAAVLLASFVVLAIGLVGCAIAVPMWMHRCFRNLPALGVVPRRWSPAWAAVGWFIPVAQLVIPYMVAVELWRLVSLEGPSSPPIVQLWWGAWIGSWALRLAAGQVAGASDAGGIVLTDAGDLALLLAGALLILFVRHVTQAQRLRGARVVAGA